MVIATVKIDGDNLTIDYRNDDGRPLDSNDFLELTLYHFKHQKLFL